MLRSKSPLVDNREIVMMLLHFAVTFCHVTMSFYEDKYCRLLGPFYINYKSRVHQSYHVLVIVDISSVWVYSVKYSARWVENVFFPTFNYEYVLLQH